MSRNGEKMLYRGRASSSAASSPTDEAAARRAGALKLDEVEVHVDPRAEWRQMYREVWRIERDFLYDPDFHGLDLTAAAKRSTSRTWTASPAAPT